MVKLATFEKEQTGVYIKEKEWKKAFQFCFGVENKFIVIPLRITSEK